MCKLSPALIVLLATTTFASNAAPPPAIEYLTRISPSMLDFGLYIARERFRSSLGTGEVFTYKSEAVIGRRVDVFYDWNLNRLVVLVEHVLGATTKLPDDVPQECNRQLKFLRLLTRVSTVADDFHRPLSGSPPVPESMMDQLKKLTEARVVFTYGIEQSNTDERPPAYTCSGLAEGGDVTVTHVQRP